MGGLLTSTTIGDSLGRTSYLWEFFLISKTSKIKIVLKIKLNCMEYKVSSTACYQ